MKTRMQNKEQIQLDKNNSQSITQQIPKEQTLNSNNSAPQNKK